MILFQSGGQGSQTVQAQPWSLTNAVSSIITPAPAVTKPTSAGPLPVRPGGASPSLVAANKPLPSYHSLLENEEGAEEVAVADISPDHIGKHSTIPHHRTPLLPWLLAAD